MGTMNSGIDYVIFDLGNVLIEWDRSFLYRQLINDPEELNAFLDNVFTMDDNAELDRGTPVHDVAANVARRHPEQHDLVMAFAERWKDTLGEVISGSVEILEQLSRNGVRLLALSNWGRDTFASIEADYPFFELFDGMVISGREGVIKPDRAIFDILCDRYDVTPSRAVFIDDSSANVATAMALGFDSLLFDRPELLRQQLIYRQLLDPTH